jgi:hypothetical protein
MVLGIGRVGTTTGARHRDGAGGRAGAPRKPLRARGAAGRPGRGA